MRITSKVVVTLLLITLSAVGCSSHQAATPAAPSVPPSSPGTYTAGATITLANQAQIMVPAGWEASLNTTGAYVDRRPAGSGIIGCALLPASPRLIQSVGLNVTGPAAGFASDLAKLEALYRRSSPVASSPTPVSRTRVTLSGPASATAFVSDLHRMAGIRDIDVFIEHPGRSPIYVTSGFQTFPASMEASSDAGLPAAFLQFLGFRWE